MFTHKDNMLSYKDINFTGKLIGRQSFYIYDFQKNSIATIDCYMI